VLVSELTVLEAQEAIRACLADGVLREPQLKLTMVDHRSQKVELVGAVAKPGEYFLDGEITLRAMLARAGGVELDRTTGVVAVVRGEERITMTLDQVGGDTDTVHLQPGDVILVEQSEVVLIGGQVAKPGPVAFTEGMTVTQALLRAGDATPVANLARSYILRDGAKIPVNIRKMRKGRGEDFALEPGDTLFIPESPI
jgi:polysaccharide export outer membrane protein